MRIGFAGTPVFAAVALRALIAAGHELALVLTQPDRPAGRGMKLQASPVKTLALENGLSVLQPRSLRLDGKYPDDAHAAQQALQQAAPQLLVVAAYGLILPAWVLELPPRGCLNIHGSLLPRWRGAAPIQRAIEAGDAQTGITIMQMDAGLDTGDMLLEAALPIGDEATSASLHDELAALGARLIVQALAAPDLPRRPQPAEGVTYAPKIEKSEAPIDWTRPAAEIERRIRAFDPFPGCSFELDGVQHKVWRARVEPPSGGQPGEVLSARDGRLLVACGDGTLALEQLQQPGGRRSDAAAWLQAHPALVGRRLGSSAA
ncbi:methionyl-tRNA formyltransferase [Aquincola sp. S2]|uniref:Methionyl-tRNA formyltransferase n=1 Tax=Pseudaquabacterium terrae TaxID=2732868 RepID=A0ABX2EDE8_9BURK|nr:methionyl-tRNA formyltransferase [Aquabacterium terrae]NRF66687.1 methionyl-tRNA formyltransferase [Aquabacterium terrae]